MAANGASQRKVNPWIIAITVSLATFMEVMDISIANVALRHIAGSVGADQSEATWVLTSYLVSNAIVLPISGWLASYVGRKRFYMTCVAIFTVSSFLCGIAPTLGMLLFFRVLQGAGGGGLAPSEQAILTDTFPAQERGMAFAIYGVAVVVAPAIGPTLGGWITDNFSWRWIFFINIPMGAISLALTGLLVTDSPAAKAEHKKARNGKLKIDYVGFALVALGLRCLQVVLDKGQEDDWFSSHFILIFSILTGVGIVGMIVWELWVAESPVVDLGMMKDSSFFFSNVMMFALGFVLLASTQLLPQIAQDLFHYDATKAGLLLMPGGFSLMALMPVVGLLVRKIQPKYLIAWGYVLSAAALWYLCSWNTDISFRNLAMGRMFQTTGLAFLFVPINTLAYSGLPKGKSNHASALINLMRNLGGSVGISVATTILARRSQVHQNYLAGHVTPTAGMFARQLQGLTHTLVVRGVNAGEASKQALVLMVEQMGRQAEMLSYIDIFMVLIIGCLAAIVMSVFLKRMDLSHVQASG